MVGISSEDIRGAGAGTIIIREIPDRRGNDNPSIGSSSVSASYPLAGGVRPISFKKEWMEKCDGFPSGAASSSEFDGETRAVAIVAR